MQITRVVPVWVKVAGLLLLLTLLGFQLFSQSGLTEKNSSEQVIPPAPSLRYGLVGKVVANTKQVTTQLFSPVVEADSAPTIIRTTGDKPYYRDKETDP